MKRFAPIGLVVALAAVSAASPVLAEDMGSGFYVSVSAGYFMPQDVDGTVSGVQVTGEYEDGYHLTGAVGYRFSNGFRVEGEVGYASTAYDSLSGNGTKADLTGDVDIWSFQANGYYDIKTGTAFTPYVGAGAGVAHTEVGAVTATLGNQSVSASGGSSTDPVVMGELGIGIAVGSNMVVAPAYRYSHLFNGQNGLDDNAAHTVKLGLRYNM